MRYLITGHTGFKGAWLTLWLATRGHEVSGLALNPDDASLFESAEVAATLALDLRGDIRDPDTVLSAIERSDPEVIIHLAAQPLVRESYLNPRWTIETNVLGTFNVLEAAAQAPHLAACLIVTTDKVYRNVGQAHGYIEEDPLGGDDPYSASKAMADILTHSWVKSFPGPPAGIARAGNVIGGGDHGRDRLFPDIMRSFEGGTALTLRYPDAVRPWQHVLDCINGYTTLLDQLLTDDGPRVSGAAWNFGPGPESYATVEEITRLASERWGANTLWQVATPEFREAHLLTLDSHKAEAEFGWKNLLDFEDAVAWTVDWHQSVAQGDSPRDVTLRQLASFEEVAGK